MYLLDKFLVTGGNTLNPRPSTPHASLEAAVASATGMLGGEQWKQDAVIIWAPVKVVRRKPTPVEVLDPSAIPPHV